MVFFFSRKSMWWEPMDVTSWELGKKKLLCKYIDMIQRYVEQTGNEHQNYKRKKFISR